MNRDQAAWQSEPTLSEFLSGYAARPINAGESGGQVWQLDAPGRERLFLKRGESAVAADIVDEFARLEWLAGRWPVPVVR